MRRAKETRQLAWDALGQGQYWPFMGGNLVLSFATGIACAIGVLFALMAGVALFFLLVGGVASGIGSFGDFAARALDRWGPGGFSILFCVGGLAAANLFILPLVYVSGFWKWGVATMSLAVLDRRVRFEQAFSGWGHGWRLGWIIVVAQTYAFLWTLLFIVPGIVKLFSYAMTDFVAVEHPDWSANRCIAESCRLMAGNRWRLFCLYFSFIGWWLLLVIGRVFLSGFGVADFFFAPYPQAAKAVFYAELKGARPPETA